VDDWQRRFAKGGLKLGDDRNAWLDILDFVAERFSKSARLAKVPLHIDADQGNVVIPELVGKWLRVDFRHVLLFPLLGLDWVPNESPQGYAVTLANTRADESRRLRCDRCADRPHKIARAIARLLLDLIAKNQGVCRIHGIDRKLKKRLKRSKHKLQAAWSRAAAQRSAIRVSDPLCRLPSGQFQGNVFRAINTNGDRKLTPWPSRSTTQP
jgi:hypothetical protein